MKKKLFSILFIIMICSIRMFAQPSNDTTVYLLTCGPGTDTYSIYGHSAIRIKILSKNSDTVYNWGLFEFDTKNFAWKFAKGRLDYMVGAEPLKSFLKEYVYYKRYVYSQKLNFTPKEIRTLSELININLRPENVKYRYDFFYDDCSTRIRDLFEKAVGENLRYPPAELGRVPSFRQMVAKYQAPYQWLQFGIDLIMGSTSDKKAMFRDRMFLPIDMMEGLSKTSVFRDGKMIPLLRNPDILVNFDPPSVKQSILISPAFVFTLVIVIMLIMAALTKSRKIIRIMDIVIYFVFSVLAVLMIFFNFFTDHQQMTWNFNILWLNPFIIVCLIMLILNKPGVIWFRTVFFISAAFLVIQFVLPQKFEVSFLLLDVMILVRSSVRGDFEWNPLSISNPV